MIYIIGHFLLPSFFFLLQQLSSVLFLWFYWFSLSPPSCLVLSQSSSEEQSECTSDESSTAVRWCIAHILYVSLCWQFGHGWYVWSAWWARGSRKSCHGGDGGHCWPCRCYRWGHRMSHVQFSVFSAFLWFLTSILAKHFLPYTSEGISISLLMAFLLFLCTQLFSSWGKKRASPACSRGYMRSPGLFSPACRYWLHPPSKWSSPHQPCLWGGQNESSESQSCSMPWGGNPFWKSIYIVLYTFLSVGSQAKPSKSLF